MTLPNPHSAAGLIAGALSGIGGGLVFATLHAILIVPIWDRMTGGLAFGALAGAAAGAAFAEFFPHAIGERSARTVLQGAAFGGFLWLVVAPVTIADAILRYAGIAPRLELVAVAVAIILAVSAGGLFGWMRAHTRRAALIGAAATMLLVIAMAGPVPIGKSPRALGIFLAVLPAGIFGGGVMALLAPSIFRRTTPAG